MKSHTFNCSAILALFDAVLRSFELRSKFSSSGSFSTSSSSTDVGWNCSPVVCTASKIYAEQLHNSCQPYKDCDLNYRDGCCKQLACCASNHRKTTSDVGFSSSLKSTHTGQPRVTKLSVFDMRIMILSRVTLLK